MIRPEFKFDKKWMYQDSFQKIRGQRRAELRNLERTIKSELPSIWHVFNSVLTAAERSYDARNEADDGLTFDTPGRIAEVQALEPELRKVTIAKLCQRAKGQARWTRGNRLARIDKTAQEVKWKVLAQQARAGAGIYISRPTSADLDAMNKWLGRD